MKSIEHSIVVAVLSAVALAAGSAGAQDNERVPGKSSGIHPDPAGGASAAGRGGKSTESYSPYTGNPGRTGAAATAEGAPSRDPTASRDKHQRDIVGDHDRERVPGQSSGVQPAPSGGGAAAAARGGKGTESQVPYTGNPGRTGSAATAEGVPSRDPTASRRKHEEAPARGRSSRSPGTNQAAGTDSAGSLTGQSVGESVGKGVSEGRPNR